MITTVCLRCYSIVSYVRNLTLNYCSCFENSVKEKGINQIIIKCVFDQCICDCLFGVSSIFHQQYNDEEPLHRSDNQDWLKVP